MFFIATDCRDDASRRMREVIVCLKDAPRETDPEILAFRKELADQQNVRVFYFDNLESLGEQLRKVCGEWVQSIIAAAGELRGGGEGGRVGGLFRQFSTM